MIRDQAPHQKKKNSNIFFLNVQIYMTDAECAAEMEKSIFDFSS